MTLSECCKLAQDMTHIPITPLETVADCAEFCALHQFHPMQEYLLPRTMERFLESISEKEIVSIIDLFRVKMLFFRIGTVPLAVGPFCSEFFSLNDCESVLRQLELKNFSPNDLLAHRGRLPISQESFQRHIIHCVFRAMEMPIPEEIREINYNKKSSDTHLQDVASNIPYAQLVEQRYDLETALMKAVEQGDVVKALANWNELHNSVAFLKRIGQTLENARVAAAITRTVIRIGAMNAGIPPIVNDSISSVSAGIIRRSRTIDEIDQEHERLIREYCQIIRRKLTTGHSNLTVSVLYYLDHSYAQQITMQSIADELEIPTSRIISQFKKELGITPLAYLNRLRMQHAAHSLAHSKTPIHEIAASVGIMDANYFVKRFKAEFRDTPSNYRMKYSL